MQARQTNVSLASAPPFLGISPNGEPAGYAVEVVNLALKGMGLPPLTPVKTDWSAMIPGLQAHQYDFVAPGLSYRIPTHPLLKSSILEGSSDRHDT